MKILTLITILSAIMLFDSTCPQLLPAQSILYSADNQAIQYTGRIDFTNPKKPRLISAGAYFQVKFSGSDCELMLEGQSQNNNRNYLSFAIDGQYQKRIKLVKDQTKYQIARNLKDADHTLLACKASEAQIGYIDFLGINCEKILPFENNRKRKIEFIGDSITCGTGLDSSEVSCASGEWYDQQNAYLAYGPTVARELNADWLLSAVSGIGVSRNWNGPGPTLPEVYFNAYLNADSTSSWDAKNFTPDLISICLGTNDFSDGDGKQARAALDQDTFVSSYVNFVKRIRNRYPNAQICCLTSPAISSEKGAKLADYLSKVIRHFQEVENDKKIHMFVFPHNYNHGCTGHPDKEEHEKLAKELLPFFKKVMDWE